MAQETNKTAASNQPGQKKNRHLRLQLLEQDA